jgi:glycosyltransferase involved in cell wall biosynthesis
VPDPAALLPGFDVFALPSLWEGLPVALLEAMRAGLPAVGSRVAGIEEAIDHERTGLLVPPADAAALAHAILDLAADAGRRAAYRERALERIGRFRAAEAARAYRQLYIRMLDPSQSTSSRSLDAGRARKVSSL